MKRPACSLLYSLLFRLTAARRSSACLPAYLPTYLSARLLRFFHAWVLLAFHRGRLGVSAFFLREPRPKTVKAACVAL